MINVKKTNLAILFTDKTTLEQFKQEVHRSADRLTTDMFTKIKTNSKTIKST